MFSMATLSPKNSAHGQHFRQRPLEWNAGRIGNGGQFPEDAALNHIRQANKVRLADRGVAVDETPGKELDRGQGIPFEGNYSQWLDAKNKRLEGEKKSNTAAAKAVAAELEWVRSNPKAKGVKSKARLRRYDELLLAAAPTEMRTEGQIYIPPGPRLGDVVIDVHGVRKAFGDRLLFDGLEFNLPKAGIVGVIGPNGAGNVYLCFSFVVIMHALTHWISHSYVRKIYFDQNANGKRYTRCRHNYSR